MTGPDPVALRVPLTLLVGILFLYLHSHSTRATQAVAPTSIVLVALLTAITGMTYGQFAMWVAFYWVAAVFILINFAIICLTRDEVQA